MLKYDQSLTQVITLSKEEKMKIEEFLKKNKISIRRFAKLIGVSYGTIFNIKIGRLARQETAEKVVKGSNGQIGYEDLGYISINGTWVRPYEVIEISD